MNISNEELREIVAGCVEGVYPTTQEMAMAVELLAAREAHPVEPITRAMKYPVSRPAPGRNVIVWDETGVFIGYGISVDTRESGVAIQIRNGRRFDSNHILRWQYTLAAPPAPAAPVSFDALADAVKEVTGGIRIEFSAETYKGHHAVPFMNFNSLSRIVEMFRFAPSATTALEKKKSITN